jgi:hypothetical protein
MRTGNRRPDPIFAPTEKLFRRYSLTHFQDGEFTGMALSFSNPISVNRSKYSRALDVLFSEANEWEGFGVVSFQVRHIPPRLLVAEPTFCFYVAHTPLQDNYAHSDIRSHRINEDPNTFIRPSSGVRKILRTELSRALVWEIRASR